MSQNNILKELEEDAEKIANWTYRKDRYPEMHEVTKKIALDALKKGCSIGIKLVLNKITDIDVELRNIKDGFFE